MSDFPTYTATAPNRVIYRPEKREKVKWKGEIVPEVVKKPPIRFQNGQYKPRDEEENEYLSEVAENDPTIDVLDTDSVDAAHTAQESTPVTGVSQASSPADTEEDEQDTGEGPQKVESVESKTEALQWLTSHVDGFSAADYKDAHWQTLKTAAREEHDVDFVNWG